LTESVLKSAINLGADVELGCRFKSARTDSGNCVIEYEKDGEIRTVTTKAIINASGPWINSTLSKIAPTPRHLEIDQVQGSHILVSEQKERGVYYLEAPKDQRAVLVMPWNGDLLIGTTEKEFQGDPADVTPTEDEIDYLLGVYNHYFTQKLDRSSIKGSFAGIRVLKRESNSIFYRSRETILHRDKKNSPMVLSIYGGKLSSYRATGEKVVKKMAKLLPKASAVANTRRVKLP
jgi:glycerol-3-phosphate dehydrogenase